VVTDFEDVCAKVGTAVREQACFGFRLRVAGEQHRHPSEIHAQNDRIVVDVRRRAGDQRLLGRENGDVRRWSEFERFAAAGDAIRDATCANDVEGSPVRWTSIQLGRVVKRADPLALQNDRQSAGVIALGN
jgi:hypothetical protein